MRSLRDRLIFKALVALDEIVDRSHDAPIAPNSALRFCLAFLYDYSDGRREPYDAFWRQCQDPQEKAYSGDGGRDMRATQTRIAWNGILNGLGWKPSIELMSSIQKAKLGKRVRRPRS